TTCDSAGLSAAWSALSSWFRRLCCIRLMSSACLRLWGNSQHSLVSHHLPLRWGLSAPVHQHTLGVLVHGGSGEAAVRCLPAGVAWLAVPRPQIGFVDR